MTTDPIQQADALVDDGRVPEAIALVRALADRNDPSALMRLATWHLIGHPLPRDLALARHFLKSAVEHGHVDAALMEVALTANGSGGPEDWATARALLQQAARTDPLAQAQLDLVLEMCLDEAGRPTAAPGAERLSHHPDVCLFRGLLTPAECLHLAQAAEPVMEPAQVADPRTGRLMPHLIRTSDAGLIGPTREDLAIRAINHRLAAISGTTTAQGEPLVVLRYAPGQQYRAHLDSLPNVANQRILTVLVYLNEGYAGGETAFTETGLKVRGRIGDAILFRNATADGRPDPASRHAGLPVSSGHKWLATRWIRERPIDIWHPAG
jgi:prolyl 4-hydroxylase